MIEPLKELLFDDRINAALSKAHIFHSLRGQYEEANEYLELRLQIEELKIQMKDGK